MIANTGVIVAGLLVMTLGSRIPDLAVGSIVAVVVVRGGLQILADAGAPPDVGDKIGRPVE